MSATCWITLPRDLERLVREALSACDVSARVRVERASAAFALAAARRCCGAGIRADAELELLRLHAVELAFQLRAAARSILRPEAAPEDGAARRGRLREALQRAAEDGLRASPALFAVLESCLRSAGGGADDARDLARAALALHDVEEGRVLAAEALLAAGDAAGAERAFALALARRPSPRAYSRLVAGWVAAAGSAGHRARARAIELASRASEAAA